MTIEPLRREHVREVAALHCSKLTGLLADLGPAAARTYYDACVDEPLAVTRVAVDSGRVVGFVAGSPSPDELRAKVRAKGPLRLALSLAAGVLRRPAVLGSLVPELLGRAPAPIDRSVPELTYIVASEPGRGLGRSLLDAFAAGMLEQGTKRFELSVDEGNPGAIAFYERTGFRRVGEYEEFGRRHFRYAFGG